MTETIFALSSGAGRAGIAVIRISGAAAASALCAVAGRRLPGQRVVSLRTLRDPATGEALDRALVLWLPGPRTVTGEDMAELHVHGGRAVVAGVLRSLAGVPGCRPADAGEFTRRAFANGRMDLTQVEGLADLLEAETAAQRRQALAQAEGGLAARVGDWRARLVRALALVEAEIDFSDEDLPGGLEAEALAAVGDVAAEMHAALAGAGRAEIVREGVSAVILGPPNAGKSSLLNRLAGREAAIVSHVSGTTRDVIEVRLELGGIAVTLADTAGLRETDDPVEREGVARAAARARGADVALLVCDGASDVEPVWPEGVPARRARVLNKCDLVDGTAPEGSGCFAVSALTGEGIGALERWLGEQAAALAGEGGAEVGEGMVTRLRQRHALEAAVVALGRLPEAEEAALRAEEIRLALGALARLAGRADVEDVLDVVFRDFCIGK